MRAEAILALAALSCAGVCSRVDAVQFITHRGDMAVERENSLAAVKRAHAYGAKGCEIDVRMRPDGTLALGHAALEAGADTFESVLAFMAANDMFPLLDVKEPKAERPAIDLVRKYGLAGRTLTIVYGAAEAKRQKALEPAISPFILMHREKGESDDAWFSRYMAAFRESGADGAFLSTGGMALARRFREGGFRTMFGSFTAPRQAGPYASVGDFVIIDDPAFAGDCAGIEHDIPQRETDAITEWRLLSRDIAKRGLPRPDPHDTRRAGLTFTVPERQQGLTPSMAL